MSLGRRPRERHLLLFVLGGSHRLLFSLGRALRLLLLFELQRVVLLFEFLLGFYWSRRRLRRWPGSGFRVEGGLDLGFRVES